MDIGLQLQGLYYASLQIFNVKQIEQIAESWPSKFLPVGFSSLIIQTCNPMSNSQAHNALVLLLNTIHQMKNSSIKNLSGYDIVMPITQEEFFCALSVKSVILICFISDDSLVFIKLSDATEILQWARNKLEILAITYAQVYTKILYIIDKRFKYWVQECIIYPTNLDEIDWELIDFIDIISNINNVDLQPGPLPPIFRSFDTKYTKTTKGSSKNYHSDHPSRKSLEKQRLQSSKLIHSQRMETLKHQRANQFIRTKGSQPSQTWLPTMVNWRILIQGLPT